MVNLTVKRVAPGFQVGKTGKTLYGTDLANPWGFMYHRMWPRCVAEGTITTKDGPIDFKGRAFFVKAIQGMKPHHAAARWTFCNFQGPTYSAIIMEFTTPPSYGSTTVNVGGIAKDGEIICAGCSNTATHVETKGDSDNDWPEPTRIKFTWSGTTKDGKPVEALLEGALEERLDRIDVMAEVPGFVKSIVKAAAGTKPYIYQVRTEATRCARAEPPMGSTNTKVVFPSSKEAFVEAQDWRRRDHGRGRAVQRSYLHYGLSIQESWSIARLDTSL